VFNKGFIDCWVVPVRPRLVITVSVILLVAVLLIVGATAKAQTSQSYTQVIMNLLNGQQYFGVPHVYQGDGNGVPTGSWPLYYGPSVASQYWSPISTSINQPVLDLTPLAYKKAGAMFWSETYSGGVINITIIGTFSGWGSQWWCSGAPAHGFEIYLFLTPTRWGVSPKYNYSISYISTPAWEGTTYPSPTEGDVILPQSSTPYIEVQWDPYWQIGYTQSGATGQWNVWIVNNTNGNNPSVSPSPSPNFGSLYAGWGGIGIGAFQPYPGDLIKITVIYDPSINALSGVVTDLNTKHSASFTLYLGNYFTPPGSGNYVFGIGASTSDCNTADWALLYVAVTQQLPSLAVQVFSAPNRLATSVPGVVYGVLYNSSGFGEVAFMNSSGFLNFNGVPSGTYTLEVYHYPSTGLNLTEYWGSETIDVQPGYNVVNFTRGEPWIYDLQPVRVNGQVVINVTIDNPSSTTLGAYVHLWVTTNPSTANPNQPTATQPITIHPGLNEYTFYYPASQAGTYYVYAALLTYNGTQYIVTDQWNWVTIQPPTYSVVFTEVGLPPGVAWNVTLSGVTESSGNSSIIFTVSNGEYYYSVASPILVNGVEYIATEPNGTVTINNNNVTVTIHYMPVNTITTITSSMTKLATNVKPMLNAVLPWLPWVVAIMLIIAIIAILMRKRSRGPRSSEGTETQVMP